MWQHSVHDGEITLPVHEGTQHTHPLTSFLSNLIDVRRPGELCIFKDEAQTALYKDPVRTAQ